MQDLEDLTQYLNFGIRKTWHRWRGTVDLGTSCPDSPCEIGVGGIKRDYVLIWAQNNHGSHNNYPYT